MNRNLISMREEKTHADDVFEVLDEVEVAPQVELPPRFEMKDDGLYVKVKDSQVRASGRFTILSRSRDFEHENHGIEIEFLDRDKTRHRTIISNGELRTKEKAVVDMLVRKGLDIVYGYESDLIEALVSAVVTKTSRRVDRIGWHGMPPSVFVLHDQAIGGDEESVRLADALRTDTGFSSHGILSTWQEVARLTRGNDLLLFATSIGFAGPLLRLLSADSVIFHLRGPSSIGKTTAAKLMATVWGKPSIGAGFMHSWRSTVNALELVCASRCDTTLILDEVQMASPLDVANAAYLIASGAGKARMAKDLSKAPVSRWLLCVLSTGEVSLESHLANAGRRATGGQAVRFLDITADARCGMGLFQNLHGVASAHEFSRAIASSLNEAYGVAGPEFLRSLVMRKDFAEEFANRVREEFEVNHCPIRADGQVRRVCAQFGLVAAAGALAAEFQVAPWNEDEAKSAAAFCFRAWLSERGHAGSQEIETGIAHLRTQILRAEEVGFADWNSGLTPARYGFRRTFPTELAGFYVFHHEMEQLLRGHSIKPILEALKDRGHLITDSGRLTKQAKNPRTGSNMRFYCLTSVFVHGDPEAPLDIVLTGQPDR